MKKFLKSFLLLCLLIFPFKVKGVTIESDDSFIEKGDVGGSLNYILKKIRTLKALALI